jgi:hypothetical protein
LTFFLKNLFLVYFGKFSRMKLVLISISIFALLACSAVIASGSCLFRKPCHDAENYITGSVLVDSVTLTTAGSGPFTLSVASRSTADPGFGVSAVYFVPGVAGATVTPALRADKQSSLFIDEKPDSVHLAFGYLWMQQSLYWALMNQYNCQGQACCVELTTVAGDQLDLLLCQGAAFEATLEKEGAAGSGQLLVYAGSQMQRSFKMRCYADDASTEYLSDFELTFGTRSPFVNSTSGNPKPLYQALPSQCVFPDFLPLVLSASDD